MLFDLNKKQGHLDNAKYNVCICGAGPAGITIARSLAKEGNRVCLLEGGDLEYTESSQSIYNGQSIGYEYWDGVHDNRLRYLGGGLRGIGQDVVHYFRLEILSLG